MYGTLIGSALFISGLVAVDMRPDTTHHSAAAASGPASGEMAVGGSGMDAVAQGSGRPSEGDAAVPLSVFSLQVNAEQPTATFMLQNTGAKTITAWHVTISVGNSTTGKGSDGYRGFAGLTSDTSSIMPGASITVTTAVARGAADSSPAVTITPTCAVFEDRSFAGDATFADFVFQRRGAELAAWRQITDELEQARAAGVVGVTALERVLSTIDGSLQNNAGDVVRQTVRTNLSLAIADARAGRASPATRFDGLLDNARRNLAAARAHSRH